MLVSSSDHSLSRSHVLSLVAPTPEPTVELTRAQLRDLLLLAHLGAHTLKSLPSTPASLLSQFTNHLTFPELQRIANDGLRLVSLHLQEITR